MHPLYLLNTIVINRPRTKKNKAPCNGKNNVYLNNDVAFSKAMQLASSSVLPMALKAAVELGLFEIMASSEHNFLSPTEIASQISTQNPEAPVTVERILRFLASSSVLKCEITEMPDGERLVYGLTPVCKYFVRNKDGVSLAPYLLFLQDKVVIDAWYHLKCAIIDGIVPFNKAHRMSAFEYAAKDRRFNQTFNEAMYNITTITMNKILQVYKGFEDLTQVVDVGGGTGANLVAIVSKYPNIKGINYDLPHVIKDAPPCQGVEHVGGDMFEFVPNAEVIFLKYILHGWNENQCIKLLKNCRKALSEFGKIIVVEALLPQYPETDDISNNTFCYDLKIMALSPGGKERTEREYDALARQAGFARTKVICKVHNKNVIEFYKM